jgi:hypothetical protein
MTEGTSFLHPSWFSVHPGLHMKLIKLLFCFSADILNTVRRLSFVFSTKFRKVVSFPLVVQAGFESTAAHGAVWDPTLRGGGGISDLRNFNLHLVLCLQYQFAITRRQGSSIHFCVLSSNISNRYCERTTPFIYLVNLIHSL